MPGAPVSAFSNAGIVLPAAPTEVDLSLEKTGSTSVVSGDVIDYQLTVTNNGGAASPNAVVSDTLPAGVTMSPGQVPGNCFLSGSFLSCSVGQLDVGSSQTIQFQANAPTVTSSTTLINQAAVTGPEIDPVQSNNTSQTSTTVVPEADADANVNASASAGADANGNPAAQAAADADAYTQALRLRMRPVRRRRRRRR